MREAARNGRLFHSLARPGVKPRGRFKLWGAEWRQSRREAQGVPGVARSGRQRTSRAPKRSGEAGRGSGRTGRAGRRRRGGTGGARIHQGNAGGQGRAPGNHRRQSNRAAHQQHTDGTQETKVTKTYRDSRKQGTFYPLRILRGVRKGYKTAQRIVNQWSELRLRHLVCGKVTPVLLYGGQLFELPRGRQTIRTKHGYLRASLGVFLSMESVQRQEEKCDMKKVKNKSSITH